MEVFCAKPIHWVTVHTCGPGRTGGAALILLHARHVFSAARARDRGRTSRRWSQTRCQPIFVLRPSITCACAALVRSAAQECGRWRLAKTGRSSPAMQPPGRTLRALPRLEASLTCILRCFGNECAVLGACVGCMTSSRQAKRACLASLGEFGITRRLCNCFNTAVVNTDTSQWR